MTIRSTAAWVACALLAACGSGGESPGATATGTSPPAPSPAPGVPTISPTPAPPGVTAVPAESQALDWSAPATWGGTLPPAGAEVVIPAGRAVRLDISTPALAGLRVEGALYVADTALTLTAGYVAVTGLLQAGTEAAPLQSRVTITLTGTDEVINRGGFGNKFIGAGGGGRIELHGARRDVTSWTRLADHARPGDTEIVLAEVAAWRVGDSIAIAPSGFDAREAERVTITSVTGNRLGITPALKHRHWGQTQTYEGRLLDQRASVGLLTRDLVVQGDTDSDASQFGGHVMVMPGGFARVSGVEFRRMGQAGHIGRYPMHWHHVSRSPANGVDGSGQYAVGNSFHSNYQRAIVMHGSSRMKAHHNVAYLTPNHAFVPAEDGDEEDNDWRHNLAILTRPALHGQTAFPTFADTGPSAGETIQNEGKPAAFWMRNTNQTLIGNVAAGVVGGAGFFFDGFVQFDAGSPATATLQPQRPARGVVFEDNTAHSICGIDDEATEATFWTAARSGWDYSIYEGAARFHGLFVLGAVRRTTATQPVLQFKRFTAYKSCGSGAWLETEGEQLLDSIVADNHKGVDPRDAPTVARTVIVGPSANDVGGRAPTYYGLLFNDSLGSGLRVSDVSFVNIRGGALHLTDDFAIGAGRVERLRLVDSIPLSGSGDLRGAGTSAMLDVDGSLTGTGRPTRISLSPLGAASVATGIPAGTGTATLYLTPQ